MKSLLLAAWARVRRAVAAFCARLVGSALRFLNPRPALKRGLAGFVLAFIGCLLFVPVFGVSGGFVWAAALIAMFWGLAAERTSTDWGDILALPHVRDFAPWHWHALERKRFLGTVAGVLCALLPVLALEAF